MKNTENNTTGMMAAAGDATNVFEIMRFISYYQEQAAYARQTAKDSNPTTALTPFKDVPPSKEFDAGAEYEQKAQEWQTILESIIDAKREALGKTPTGIVNTKVVDSKGVETKATGDQEIKGDVENANTKLEDDVTEETTVDTLQVLAADDKKRREIITLWNMKKAGTYIMDNNDDTKFAPVVAGDLENKYFVVENRHIDGVDTPIKRTLHTKEHAVLMYREYMESKGIDISEKATPEIKVEITALAAEEARIQKINTRKSIEERLEALGLITMRNEFNVFTGEELINRAGKFIEGDEFNMLILAGTDDASALSSEDQVKLKAIQLTAIGAKTEAVSLVYTYFKEKEGMTRQLAEAYVHKLMRENPYQEPIMAIRRIFEYYNETAKDHTKGRDTARNLLNSYTRHQKVNAKGELEFTETGTGKKKERVPVFETWKKEKIDKFIDRIEQDMVDEGILKPASKKPAESKKDEPGKSDTEKEEVSKDQKETSKKEPVKEKSDSKPKKPDTGQSSKKDESDTTKSGTKGTDTSDEKKVDTPAEPVLTLTITSNEANTVFTAEAEGTEFKVVSKKVGDAFNRECASKFKKYVQQAHKHNKKCLKNKSLTPMVLPEGFGDDFKVGDKFTIKQVVKK